MYSLGKAVLCKQSCLVDFFFTVCVLAVQWGDAAKSFCISWLCCGTADRGEASEVFQMLFDRSGSGVLVSILFGLVAAQSFCSENNEISSIEESKA